MTTNQIFNQVFQQSGLSKIEFAYALDTDPSRISVYLSGKENIKYSTLQKLLNFYGLKVEMTVTKIA